MTTSLLKFDQLTFAYPSAAQPVMEQFSLEIAAGGVTAILGPNGAGKTTLLHLALGWLRPQRGQVWLENRPLGSHSRREMGQRMGLVPQSEHIAFEYSLLEYVLLGRAPYLPPLAMPGECDCEIAAEALKRVGLSAMENRSVLSLSGGERQLVLVARALAQQPRLLLDEPTSHLDLSNKRRLVQLLRELSAQGVTLVFTTHEPEVASALATHLVFMQKGRVLQSDSLEQAFTSEGLTRLYQQPVEVVNLAGRRMVIWD
jgi:iron complex transport system ATP-binding protein